MPQEFHECLINLTPTLTALTTEQAAALGTDRVKELKKCLGWFLGWFFIMI